MKIDELLDELASTKTALTDAQNELAELREHLRPRILSDAQATIIVQYLADRPTSAITVDFAGINAESRNFAQRIVGTLRVARWSVSQANIVGESRQGSGIIASLEYEASARDLQNAFREAGIDFPVVIQPLTDTQFWIIMGEKEVVGFA